LHAKGVEHGCGAVEHDPRRLLTDRHRGEEDWHEAVLAPRQAVARVPGYLKDKLPVSAFMEKTPRRRSPDREAAEHEWTCAETEILPVRLTVLADHLDRLDLS